MLAAQGLGDAIHLEEGSGISRDTRFTARGLAKVLELFAPHADLLHGHDGGLNKSGTMDGIRSSPATPIHPATDGPFRHLAFEQRRDAVPAPPGDQGRAITNSFLGIWELLIDCICFQ